MPTKRKGRIQRIENRPKLPPRCCLITGRSTGKYFIDMAIDFDDLPFEKIDRTRIGHVYLSDLAVAMIAEISDYVPADQYRAQLVLNEDLSEEVFKREQQLKEMRDIVNGILNLRDSDPDTELRNRLADLSAQMDGGETGSDDSEGTGENPGPSESSSEQGLGILRSTISLTPPKI